MFQGSPLTGGSTVNIKRLFGHLNGQCPAEISRFYDYSRSLLYYLNIGRKITKSDGHERKEILTKERKQRLKKFTFHKNGNFDFLTACHEIKFDEL